MKKAVLIIAFIFILLSVSQVSAVLIYNSAKSNVSNKILEDVGDAVEFFKEVKKAEPQPTSPKEVAKEIHINVLSSVTILHGSWDELDDVPCDWREELGLKGCATEGKLSD